MADKKQQKSKNDLLVGVLIALLIGWSVGYFVGAGSVESDSQIEEPPTTTTSHDLYEVTGADAPSIKVYADADELGGWNIRLITENFKFTPENANQADVLGEGHAHLWVDGVKINRLYSNNYYLAALGEGDHEITVTLNTNKHKDYAVDGTIVGDSITVTEMATSGDGHSHDDTEPHEH